MKNTLYLVAALTCGMMASLPAQNYKTLKVPTVEAGGKVKDADGVQVATIDKSLAVVNDMSGKQLGHFDVSSNLILDATDEKVAKSDQDGNLYVKKDGKMVIFKYSPPEPGMQSGLLRNKQGDIVAMLHKTYKQYGGPALYYFFEKDFIKSAPVAAPTKESAKSTTTKKKVVNKSTVKKKAKKEVKKKKKNA